MATKQARPLILRVRVERDGNDWRATARLGEKVVGEAFHPNVDTARSWAVCNALLSPRIGNRITGPDGIPAAIEIRIARQKTEGR